MRFGLRRDYIYLHDSDEFNMSDVISIISLIREIEVKSFHNKSNYDDQGKRDYYMSLLISLTMGLKLNNNIKDNPELDLEDKKYERIIAGFLMIRDKYISLIHCFSGDWVGNRWHTNNDELIDTIRGIIQSYQEKRQEYIEEIKKIDIGIAEIMGEEYGNTITLKELKDSHGLNIDFDDIHNRYGEH